MQIKYIETCVTGCCRLTHRLSECKHLLFYAALVVLEDRICLQNSLGVGWGAGAFYLEVYVCMLCNNNHLERLRGMRVKFQF